MRILQTASLVAATISLLGGCATDATSPLNQTMVAVDAALGVVTAQSTLPTVAIPRGLPPNALRLDQEGRGGTYEALGCVYSGFQYQTLTTGGGMMAAVEVELRRGSMVGGLPGTPPATITAKLRRGGPTGDVVGESEVLLSLAMFADEWIRFDFMPPVRVQAGELMTIEIPNDGGWGIGWRVGSYSGSTYTGGQALSMCPPSTVPHPPMTFPVDYNFATYVVGGGAAGR